MRIQLTQAMLDILGARRIFFDRRGMGRRLEPQGYRSRLAPGDVLQTSDQARIEPYVTLAGGNSLFSAGSFSSIASGLPVNCVVGRYTSIGTGVRLLGYRHPIEAVSTSSAFFNPFREFVNAYLDDQESLSGERPTSVAVPTPQPHSKPLRIGNDVWIGSGVTFKGGLHIGDGAVVGAESVVLHDVPAYAIIAGNPARLIRYRFGESTRSRLVQAQWWNYELADLYRLRVANPVEFLDEFEATQPRLREYRPDALDPSRDLLS